MFVGCTGSKGQKRLTCGCHIVIKRLDVFLMSACSSDVTLSSKNQTH